MILKIVRYLSEYQKKKLKIRIELGNVNYVEVRFAPRKFLFDVNKRYEQETCIRGRPTWHILAHMPTLRKSQLFLPCDPGFKIVQ